MATADRESIPWRRERRTFHQATGSRRRSRRTDAEPAGQDELVVGRPPKPGFDPPVRMFCDHEGHGEGKRIGRIQGSPAVVVAERETAAAITPDFAHDRAVGDSDQAFVYSRACLAASTTAWMSTGIGPSLGSSGRSSGRIVNERSSADRARRTKPTSARDLPRSKATSHCRPAPILRASSAWVSPSFRRLSRMIRPSSRGVRICMMIQMSAFADNIVM